MQYANSCNDEKSPRALVKHVQSLHKGFLFSWKPTINWKERISKKLLDGKLCYKKAKQTDQGTISNFNCNLDDRDRLCNV